MDVQRGEPCQTALKRQPADKTQEFQSQQREWLARREKECGISGGWNARYTKLAELKQR